MSVIYFNEEKEKKIILVFSDCKYNFDSFPYYEISILLSLLHDAVAKTTQQPFFSHTFCPFSHRQV